MSENNVNSNLPDAGNSLGQDKSDFAVDDHDDMTSTPITTSTSIVGDSTEKLTLSDSPWGKRDSGTISMPSLSSFASLGDAADDDDDGRRDSAMSSSSDGEDMSDYYDEEEEDDDGVIQGELAMDSPKPETRSMPVIPGLEVSKDARPGTFLTELTASADSLVNKRTPEKELGARWKDGSIPLAKLFKKQKDQQEDQHLEVQKQIKEEGEDNNESMGRERRNSGGRRNSGRRRLRSKSPPPLTGERKEDVAQSDDGSSDDDDALLMSSVPPPRPVRQVSVELPPMSPVPRSGLISPMGAFASMDLPIKPERKVSVNMVKSTTPLLSPSPYSDQARVAPKSVIHAPIPDIDWSLDGASEESAPPMQPMRQTTRNFYDSAVETITEDSTTFNEEDEVHPIMEGTCGTGPPNDGSPSLPQRRATLQDPLSILEPPTAERLPSMEEGCDDDDSDSSPTDETPSQPQRQNTLDSYLGEFRESKKRLSLIDDEE